MALIPNARGAERALAADVDEVVMVVSASETHNRANVRRSVAQSFDGFREVFDVLRGSRTRPVGAVATAFGCPFEGVVPEAQVVDCVARYVDLGVSRRDLRRHDRHGRPAPRRAARRAVRDASADAADAALPQHARDGPGECAGRSSPRVCVRFEGCLGGLGGCPFAPGATGNVCTEDVVHMLHCMGYDTGVDLDRLLAARGGWERSWVTHLPGQVVKAGKVNRSACAAGRLEMCRVDTAEALCEHRRTIAASPIDMPVETDSHPGICWRRTMKLFRILVVAALVAMLPLGAQAQGKPEKPKSASPSAARPRSTTCR